MCMQWEGYVATWCGRPKSFLKVQAPKRALATTCTSSSGSDQGMDYHLMGSGVNRWHYQIDGSGFMGNSYPFDVSGFKGHDLLKGSGLD
eukprot:UN4937